MRVLKGELTCWMEGRKEGRKEGRREREEEVEEEESPEVIKQEEGRKGMKKVMEGKEA